MTKPIMGTSFSSLQIPMSLRDKLIEEQIMSDTPGAGDHRKTIPRKRIKNAHRRSDTKLTLRVWIKHQNGQLKKWAQEWNQNKRR